MKPKLRNKEFHNKGSEQELKEEARDLCVVCGLNAPRKCTVYGMVGACNQEAVFLEENLNEENWLDMHAVLKRRPFCNEKCIVRRTTHSERRKSIKGYCNACRYKKCLKAGLKPSKVGEKRRKMKTTLNTTSDRTGGMAECNRHICNVCPFLYLEPSLIVKNRYGVDKELVMKNVRIDCRSIGNFYLILCLCCGKIIYSGKGSNSLHERQSGRICSVTDYNRLADELDDLRLLYLQQTGEEAGKTLNRCCYLRGVLDHWEPNYTALALHFRQPGHGKLADNLKILVWKTFEPGEDISATEEAFSSEFLPCCNKRYNEQAVVHLKREDNFETLYEEMVKEKVSMEVKLPEEEEKSLNEFTDALQHEMEDSWTYIYGDTE